jgi:hypothetical protein
MSSAEVLDRDDFTLEDEQPLAIEDTVGGENLDLRRNLERVERALLTRLANGRRKPGPRGTPARIRRALLYARMNHFADRRALRVKPESCIRSAELFRDVVVARSQ